MYLYTYVCTGIESGLCFCADGCSRRVSVSLARKCLKIGTYFRCHDIDAFHVYPGVCSDVS